MFSQGRGVVERGIFGGRSMYREIEQPKSTAAIACMTPPRHPRSWRVASCRKTQNAHKTRHGKEKQPFVWWSGGGKGRSLEFSCVDGVARYPRRSHGWGICISLVAVGRASATCKKFETSHVKTPYRKLHKRARTFRVFPAMSSSERVVHYGFRVFRG